MHIMLIWDVSYLMPHHLYYGWKLELFVEKNLNSAHLVEIFDAYQQDFLVAEAFQSELLTSQSRPWWIGLTGINNP